MSNHDLEYLMDCSVTIKNNVDDLVRSKECLLNRLEVLHICYQTSLKRHKEAVISAVEQQFGTQLAHLMDALKEVYECTKVVIDRVKGADSGISSICTPPNGDSHHSNATKNEDFELLPKLLKYGCFGNSHNEFVIPEWKCDDDAATYVCNRNNRICVAVITSSTGSFTTTVTSTLTLSTVASNTSTVSATMSPPNIQPINSMFIYKTFGEKGSGMGHFNSPHGFCLGFNHDVVVADSTNHRIQVFDETGCFKFSFGIQGRHDGHLWHPRKVAILLKKRQYVVCDRGYERSRMQIFDIDGKYIKKIYIQFIDIVSGIAVTANEDVVVVDSVNRTIFIIGEGDSLRSITCSDHIEEPSDLTVRGKEIFVCDFKGHCIVVLNEEGNFLRKFGNKQITTFPNGIDISASGEVLIGDSHGNFFHVSVYTTDGCFLAEFRCPYIKVSRCCGLKINHQGRLLTVDKNFHHVLVLDSPKIRP